MMSYGASPTNTRRTSATVTTPQNNQPISVEYSKNQTHKMGRPTNHDRDQSDHEYYGDSRVYEEIASHTYQVTESMRPADELYIRDPPITTLISTHQRLPPPNQRPPPPPARSSGIISDVSSEGSHELDHIQVTPSPTRTIGLSCSPNESYMQSSHGRESGYDTEQRRHARHSTMTHSPAGRMRQSATSPQIHSSLIDQGTQVTPKNPKRQSQTSRSLHRKHRSRSNSHMKHHQQYQSDMDVGRLQARTRTGPPVETDAKNLVWIQRTHSNFNVEDGGRMDVPAQGRDNLPIDNPMGQSMTYV